MDFIVPVMRVGAGLDLPLPQYATRGAAAFDLRAAIGPGNTVIVPINRHCFIPCGLAFEVPEGYELQVRGRSGLALKKGIQVHFGTVDADYRGEVGAILYNHGEEPFVVNHGDRIAQALIGPVQRVAFQEVSVLGGTQRGTAGFGSTGR